MPSVGPEWIHPKSGRVYRCGLPYPLFLPLGKPVDSRFTELEDLLYKDTELFSREYENGLIILNPTSGSGKWKFEGNDAEIVDPHEHKGDEFDVPKAYTFTLDQEYIDVETGNCVSGTIKMLPRTGKILLKEPQL